MHSTTALVYRCQRPYSIRTRIKTSPECSDQTAKDCQRPYSIRTRIKTSVEILLNLDLVFVRDHIPLEQGLRPIISIFNSSQNNVRDHIPLEQGLRQHGSLTIRGKQRGQRPYSIRTRIKTLLSPGKLQPGFLSETIFH